ncbi:hypothetical protein A4X06_0g3360 [Tilletia controversa]|uniref:Protein ZIP4 homolog n=1 Tax=Tilletia controversa TaxID=13291 RepID=A0A8X7MUU3_9BASI|nr:hypothetical protein CF328_g1507 [Tilletia controversa]KAE8249150.1 hypothetical protein A4X06_0g3360 [Tilletia controversa]
MMNVDRPNAAEHDALAKVQALFECVKDKLSLEHQSNNIVRSALAELTKTATGLRGGIDQKTADILDEQGVRLWNASITLRHLSEGDAGADNFIADVRSTAVSMLDAGSSVSLDTDAAVRLIMAYSSLLSLLSSTTKHEFEGPLSRAKELLDFLPRTEENPSNRKLVSQLEDVRRAFACACFDVDFASGRYESGDSHLSKLLDELSPSDVTIAKAEPIWRRCFQLGQHFLLQLPEQVQTEGEGAGLGETEIGQCKNAVKWLQKGITLQERAGVVGVPVVKALLQLAYAYFIAGATERSALASAEAALNESSKMLQADGGQNSELVEYIAIMRFRVTTRHGSDADISRALEQLCSTLAFNETNTAQLLDFVTHGPKRMLATGFRIIIRAMLKCDQEDVQQHVTSVVLRALFLLSDPSTLSQLDSLLDDIESSDIDLSQDAVCAAQMMIWRRGDVLYKKEMFEHAADVHMIAVHRVFASMPDNIAKSARRIAVCYLALHQPEAVKACLDLCSEPYRNNASSHLCMYLAAVQMGDEDEALGAFQALVRAPDMEPQVLVEVVEEAQKANMERVLHVGLETLLDAIKVDSQMEAKVDILTLHKTLVCIFLPPDNERAWTEHQANQLEVYLRQALKALSTQMDSNEDARKHAEWLWKHAYNAGVLASHSLDANITASLFDVAFDLMEERHRFSGEAPDSSIVVASWCAKFASVEVAALSVPSVENPSERASLYKMLQEQVELAQKLRKAAHAINPEAAPAEAEWALLMLLLKLAVATQDWSGVKELLQSLEGRLDSMPFKVAEALVHAVSVEAESEIPVEIEVQCLEFLLRRYNLEEDEKTISRTLRYHRFLLMCLLEDGTFAQAEYRRRALACFESVRDAVVEAQGKEKTESHVDDIMWYLAQAWQRGTELAMAAVLEEAKTLSELALSFSRFIPFPDATRRRMEIQYQ